ncbi:MAG: ATP-grasp domain-containing protein [Methylovirgula sp.]
MNSSETPTILIVAPSGRALAAAARRAGYRPLVADFFDDLDTRTLAAANILVAVTERGFEGPELLAQLQHLAAEQDPLGLVYGGGFEDRPELIAELGRHFPLYGNAPEVVARVKDPQSLADLCRRLAIPHPEICFELPSEPAAWLVKHAGGGGGLHIAPALGKNLEPGDYYQRRIDGRPISVLLLGNGEAACGLGLSEQWTAADSERPFRFGGALRPARLAAALAEKIIEAAEKIGAAAELVGLNSVDFLVEDDNFHLLEINPRPGATLDIFADRDGLLFAAHLAACKGRLPQQPLAFPAAGATAIFYAPCDLDPMPLLDWPDWCQDRQKSETRLHKGDPVCTVSAEAETPEAARALLDERLAHFLKYLTDSASKEAAA